LCDTSMGRLRTLVPQEVRLLVFEAIHSMAYPSIHATRRLISACFLWPRMNSDIAFWCKDYEACQHAKVTKQPWDSLQPIPMLRRRFSLVHMDLVGPLLCLRMVLHT
jgi:hypothetical protein